MPIFEGKAAIVPRPELPWLVEPEEQPVMTPVAEMTMLEMRRMTEPEDEVAVAELQHETALAEVTKVSRLEVWGMSEVPRLERPRLPKDPTVVDLEAMVSQLQLRASVP